MHHLQDEDSLLSLGLPGRFVTLVSLELRCVTSFRVPRWEVHHFLPQAF